MFYSRSLNDKINKLHEQCLRIIYNGRHSKFVELLNKDNSVSIHYNNIHTHTHWLLNCIKLLVKMSPAIMNKVFKLRYTPYHNLQHTSQLIQFIVFIMELNQHRIWDHRFGGKYVLKLKMRNLLMVLKEKSKN